MNLQDAWCNNKDEFLDICCEVKKNNTLCGGHVLPLCHNFVRFLRNWCRSCLSCLQKLLSMHDFCEDQLSAICTLLKGVNDFLL